MTPNDDDALLGALFAAAKREAPPAQVRERALERALESGRRPWARRAAAGVVLALAAGVALTLGVKVLRRAPVSVGPETVPLTQTNPSPDLPRTERTTPAANDVVHATEPAPARLEKATTPRPAPTLGDEIAQLEAARTALAQSDPKRALALLDRYRHSTRGAHLGDEALVLRLEALKQAGRVAEASALASEFVDKNPGSPLVDRAREFITGAKPAASAAPASSSEGTVE